MSASPDRWSLNRSLAFLAAVFAIVFGSLLPAAVAASPATGESIVLCAGGRLITAYQGADDQHDDAGKTSLHCASALISGLAALATPGPEVPPEPLARPGVPAPEAVAAYVIAARPAPRPPSTAPPQA